MTRIDFYILSDMTRDAGLRFACRLCLKGYQAGHPIHVHTGHQAEARDLDALMWDYPKHRFLPHEIINEQTTSLQLDSVPIHIAWQNPIRNAGMLINVTDEVPEFFGRFDRVAEIVVDETKASGRARYKHYRDRGYPLHHHELDQWETP
ncbi:MAG: DNA polymerase III subunit chi [Pseudomonadota bacterium]